VRHGQITSCIRRLPAAILPLTVYFSWLIPKFVSNGQQVERKQIQAMGGRISKSAWGLR
jgi:hypothetical protein